MGAKLQGSNITFQDNTITHLVYAGDDTDRLRFFGDGIKILHNTLSDINDGSNCDANGCGNGPHPDCMQTFYSDTYPTSSDITIERNHCENAAAQCLIRWAACDRRIRVRPGTSEAPTSRHATARRSARAAVWAACPADPLASGSASARCPARLLVADGLALIHRGRVGDDAPDLATSH